MDVAQAVPALLLRHELVERAALTGSRADGTAHELSDWDFFLETSDFARFAEALPRLVQPLRPLAAQWDRYAPHACYMLILRGPTKIDLIFRDEKQVWAPPWEPSAETLVPIDRHFWDWILWLEQKRRAGKEELLASSLEDMHRLMLEPMGAASRVRTVREAVRTYLELRRRFEHGLGLEVPRELEEEVRPVVS